MLRLSGLGGEGEKGITYSNWSRRNRNNSLIKEGLKCRIVDSARMDEARLLSPLTHSLAREGGGRRTEAGEKRRQTY